MGCGSSNAQTAVDSNGMDMKPQPNGNANGTDKIDTISDTDTTDQKMQKVPTIEIPRGEAFEIPFDDGGENGLIKKHPPKRLQRLEEQANLLAPPTIEELEEKLATAEIRRQEFLNQKVTTAKQMQKVGNEENEEGETEDKTEDKTEGDENTTDEANCGEVR